MYTLHGVATLDPDTSSAKPGRSVMEDTKALSRSYMRGKGCKKAQVLPTASPKTSSHISQSLPQRRLGATDRMPCRGWPLPVMA